MKQTFIRVNQSNSYKLIHYTLMNFCNDYRIRISSVFQSPFFIGDAMMHKKFEREIVLIKFEFLFYRRIKIWKK